MPPVFSVVVNDLNLAGTVTGPLEANTELIIDPNTVLTFSVAAQGLQLIPWRNTQFIQAFDRVKLVQFTCCNLPDVPRT